MKTVFTKLDINEEEYYEGKIIIKKLETFKPEYQEAKYQLSLAIGGFGCDPTKLGRAVFVIDCCDGESYHVNREDVLGVATEKAIQEWKSKYGDFDESVISRLTQQLK